MLEITVKTLDSQSRNFSVPDDITVQGFKEHIASSVDIPVERQRLIYQGRVLQDNTQLNAVGDISGKVIHLVERLPTPVNTNPTPAELAREPVVNRPHRSVSQQPSNQNIFGPFPVPGPGGSISGQFVQQMLQQALSGVGPAVVRGTVRHPNAPGGDSRTEIQIHIGPQGATQQTVTTSTPGRPQQNAPPTSAQQQQQQQPQPQPQQQQQQRQASPAAPARQNVPPRQNFSPHHHHHHHHHHPRQVPISQQAPTGHSIPAHHLDSILTLIKIFEEQLGMLESGNYEEADSTRNQDSSNQPGTTSSQTDTPGTSGSSAPSTSSGGEPMDVQNGQQQPQGGAAAAASSSQNERSNTAEPSRSARAEHPKLKDVARVMRRVVDLETRFLPFLTEYTNFLENDTAFESTQSPDFKKTMAFLTVVLKAQRILGQIHRGLSVIVIPLSETPPRSIRVQMEQNRMRAPPPNARPVQNVVSAGPIYSPAAPIPHHIHQGPRMIQQVRMPVLIGPIPARPGMHPMMSFPSEMMGYGPSLRPVRPHQSGLYGHPPSSSSSVAPTPTTTSTGVQPSAVTAPSIMTAGNVPQRGSDSSATESSSAPAPSSGAAHVEFAPPEYAVQVTTNIHPNININITPSGFSAGAAVSVDGQYAAPSPGEVTGEPMDESPPDGAQGYSFSAPVEIEGLMNIPNIPGIPQDSMRQIIDGVQNSLQQVLGVMRRDGDPSQQQSDRVTVTGLPGGPNQIPLDIANIVGQTVQNIVLNHMHTGEDQPEPTAATSSSTTTSTSVDTPPVTATSEPAAPSSSASSSATTSTTQSTSAAGPKDTASTSAAAKAEQTPQSSTTEADSPRNPLANLVHQVASGGYGTVTEAVVESRTGGPAANASRGSVIEGTAGKKGKKLPEIRRTPNCINDLVRGQGYPTEMMQLTGQENILSMVLYLCGELFTVNDCMTFVAGAAEPADRLREPLRRVVLECWFDGRVPNTEEIEAEVERHSEDARPSIELLFQSETPKSPDISVVESNLSLYRHVVRKILMLLFVHGSDRFVREILRHLLDCYALALNLNIHILRGTDEAVSQLITRHLGAAMDPFTIGGSAENRDPMADQMRDFIASQMIPFARNRTITQDQIDQFVMNVPPKKPERRRSGVEFVDLDALEEIQKKEQAEREEMEAEEEEKVEEKKKDEKMDAVEGAVGGGGGEADPDWRTMVPGDWVSVIESDIDKQKKMPEQPPFSEAYLAGMPASKRRKV